MCYQRVVLEGLACCALSGSFMSGTQTRKETSQDRFGFTLVILLEREQHTWTAFTQRPALEARHDSHSWNGKNVTDFAQSVLALVMGLNFENKHPGECKTYMHILFTTLPKHSSLSHTLRINIPQALPQAPQISNA